MGGFFSKYKSKSNSDKYLKFDEDNCPICLSEMKAKNTIILECYHKFHASCIFKTMATNNRKCPLCRTKIKFKYPRTQPNITYRSNIF